MRNLYQVTGDNIEECLQRFPALDDKIRLINIIIRADSYEEAGDIARDVAQEMPSLRNTKEIDIEINVLAEPTDKGYCSPITPTIKRRLILKRKG